MRVSKDRIAVAVLSLCAALALAVPVLAQAMAAKPGTAARVDESVTTSGNRVVLRLKVVGAVRGTRVQVTCRGGRAKGCPAAIRGRVKTITAARAGTLSLYPAMAGNKLASGAYVDIKMRDPGALYVRTYFRITSSSSYASATRCEQPGGKEVGCR